MAPKTKQIREHLLKCIATGSTSVVGETSEHFGITREAVYKHVRNLIKEGVVEAQGASRSRTYSIKYTNAVVLKYMITPETMSEFDVFPNYNS